MKIPGVWRIGRGEAQEAFVRRLMSEGKFKDNRGYVGVAMTSVVDIYDRVAALEARIAELEARKSTSQ